MATPEEDHDRTREPDRDAIIRHVFRDQASDDGAAEGDGGA